MPSAPSRPTTTTGLARDTLIVSFSARHTHAAAEAIIAEALLDVGVRHSVEKRTNALPTSDFALLTLRCSHPLERTRALDALRRHAAIELLSPEKRYSAPPRDDSTPPPSQPPPHAAANVSHCQRSSTCPTARRLLAPVVNRRGADLGTAGAGHAHGTPSTPTQLHAHALWRLGYRGGGVHVAVFDSGLSDSPALQTLLPHVEEVTNWTDEPDANDKVGHGSFVASVIGAAAGSGPAHAACEGLAPDAILHIFKVFNSQQLSYTSWFLDAFEHVLRSGKIHVLNLSIGGPDSSDAPFIRKVDELAASQVIIISGIGNSGPVWGTLMNPADQSSVLGVGGVDSSGGLADFSSRGMTMWELPDGYGRVKPDVLTHGQRVPGLATDGKCRHLSGTSVACPVVAGVVALLASIVPPPRRWQLLNPAVIKQVLAESARKLRARSAYEQGSGTIDLLAAAQLITGYIPRASVLPPRLDLLPCAPHGGQSAEGSHGYMWPHCAQPLYHGALPVLVNLTVLNGLALTSRLVAPPVFVPSDASHEGLLTISFESPAIFRPWCGTLGVALSASTDAASFDGPISGELRFELEALDGAHQSTSAALSVPLAVRVVPTPPREKRLLFDQWHSVRYAPFYVPRDNLAVTDELLDWQGDHLHTNMRDLFMWLRAHGYYVEILGCPYTCFNASQYGALLVVDAEAEFGADEARKLRHDIIHHGLSLVVLGEWYNTKVMSSIRFFDENTKQWWTPATGGANLPAINELLAPFGVAFGDAVLRGEVGIGANSVQLASAAPIARFPAGGWLVRALSLQDEGAKLAGVLPFARGLKDVPVVGLLQPRHAGSGRIAAFGDTECVDSLSSQRGTAPCWWLLHALLDFATEGKRDRALFPDNSALETSYAHPEPLPLRPQRAPADAPDASPPPPPPRHAANSARGVVRPSAMRGLGPLLRTSECLLARMGLTPHMHPESSSPLPDEPFGILAHWPHGALHGVAGVAEGSPDGGLRHGPRVGGAHELVDQVGGARYNSRSGVGAIVLCALALALGFNYFRRRNVRKQRLSDAKALHAV